MKQIILDGNVYLGIELGSTRIKLVLIDESCAPVATSSYEWESKLENGMDILTENEHVRLERLLGHGGLFKTKGVGQRLMAAALNVPVAVMESAGEGGAWGIAIMAVAF